MPLKPGSRIALTGGTGFVGGHVLAHLLDRGYQVNALTRKPQSNANPSITWVEGTLDDHDALQTLVRDADAVVHIAGVIKAYKQQTFFDVNVGGTERLLMAIAHEGVAPKFVQLSSLAARSPHLSPYAASKCQGDDAVQQSGLDWTILRPPGIYGPGDQETFVFFKAATSRIALLPGSGRNRTSLIHVTDMARTVETAFNSPSLSRRIVEVHDGPPLGYSLKDVIAMIAGPERRPFMLFLPRPVLQGIGAMLWAVSRITGQAPMLTPAKAREITHKDWVCNDRSLFDLADWQPQFSAQQGLTATRTWYEEHDWI